MTAERGDRPDHFAGTGKMVPDHLSAVPPFTLTGVVWRCWVTDGGQRFEWRSDDGRLTAGRDGAEYWARADGRLAGGRHTSLRAAMAAAIGAVRRAA